MKEAERQAEELARSQQMWSFERQAFDGGFTLVAGVDEAGRGPLAGPLVVAAVILPPESWLPGLNDSKKVAPRQRECLFEQISVIAVAMAIAVISPTQIDQLNILQATRKGMRDVLLQLKPSLALIDGLPLPESPCPHQAIVKGDSKSSSIAAASIIAKVTRDRIMLEMEDCYPGYGFAQHKGYPTSHHLQALRDLGPSPIHRLTYAPVARCRQLEF